jgi:hypothetical protein
MNFSGKKRSIGASAIITHRTTPSPGPWRRGRDSSLTAPRPQLDPCRQRRRVEGGEYNLEQDDRAGLVLQSHIALLNLKPARLLVWSDFTQRTRKYIVYKLLWPPTRDQSDGQLSHHAAPRLPRARGAAGDLDCTPRPCVVRREYVYSPVRGAAALSSVYNSRLGGRGESENAAHPPRVPPFRTARPSHTTTVVTPHNTRRRTPPRQHCVREGSKAHAPAAAGPDTPERGATALPFQFEVVSLLTSEHISQFVRSQIFKDPVISTLPSRPFQGWGTLSRRH